MPKLQDLLCVSVTNSNIKRNGCFGKFSIHSDKDLNHNGSNRRWVFSDTFNLFMGDVIVGLFIDPFLLSLSTLASSAGHNNLALNLEMSTLHYEISFA